jgi:starch phosphorylase
VRGEPLVVSIATKTDQITARVWQLSVGRNTLLLLDSNVEGNRPETESSHRAVWRRRAHQDPAGTASRGWRRQGAACPRYHTGCRVASHEGHSAFAALGTRALPDGRGGKSIAQEAMRRVSPHMVFTTHDTGSAATRSIQRGICSRNIWWRCAVGVETQTCAALMALGRTNPAVVRRAVLHDWFLR